MKIEVAEAGGTVRLIDPDRFTEFAIVVAEFDPARLDAALRSADAGYVEGRYGFVAASWITAQVSVTADWLAGLSKMLEFAGSRGWLTADGAYIRAHVEHDPANQAH